MVILLQVRVIAYFSERLLRSWWKELHWSPQPEETGGNLPLFSHRLVLRDTPLFPEPVSGFQTLLSELLMIF